MRISLKLFIGTIFLVSVLASFGQDDVKESQNKIKGTYQIQILKHNRAVMKLPDDIFEIIDKKRDAEEVVYHNVNSLVRVMILPNNEINAKGFTPLIEQKIVHSF